MSIIQTSVIGHKMSITHLSTLASGSAGIDYIKFNFDESWDNEAVTKYSATIWVEGKEDCNCIVDVMNDTKTCEIPGELLLRPGFLCFGVFATDENEHIIKTSTICKCEILQGAPLTEGESEIVPGSGHIGNSTGILSINTVESTEDGGENIITIKRSNGIIDSFTIRNGNKGTDGTPGTNGVNGKSAYELAVENGFAGTVSEWINSLKGTNGYTPDINVSFFAGEWKVDTEGQRYFDSDQTGWRIAYKDAEGNTISNYTVRNGKDGTTPHIGDNGNWFVGDTDTGISSRGESGTQGVPGINGHTPIITAEKTDDKTNIYSDGVLIATLSDGINGTNGTNGQNGTNGANGITPHIGDNGNWFIGDTDTGVTAQSSGSGGFRTIDTDCDIEELEPDIWYMTTTEISLYSQYQSSDLTLDAGSLILTNANCWYTVVGSSFIYNGAYDGSYGNWENSYLASVNDIETSVAFIRKFDKYNTLNARLKIETLSDGVYHLTAENTVYIGCTTNNANYSITAYQPRIHVSGNNVVIFCGKGVYVIDKSNPTASPWADCVCVTKKYVDTAIANALNR